MKDLLKTVETFLTYSEAKLEELSEKISNLKWNYRGKRR